MYLQGHIAVGYVIAWAIASTMNQPLILWLVFVASILPDYDIFLHFFGVSHGSITHTLLLIIPVSIILVTWRIETLPYVAALLTHMILDVAVGPLRILYPISRTTYTLNLGMSSSIDAAIEIGALIPMLTLMWYDGDLSRLLNGAAENLLIIIPLLLVVGSMIRAALRMETWRRAANSIHETSRTALEAITFGHVILFILMTSSVTLALIRL